MTDIDFSIPQDAPPAEPPSSNGEVKSHGTCTECGAPTYRAGTRGRFPTKCDIHKKVSRSSSSKGVARVARKDIEEGVTGIHDTIAMAIGIKDPELAAVIIGPQRLERMMSEEAQEEVSVSTAAGKAWAKLARNNDAVNKTLERMLTGGEYMEVFSAYLPLVLLTAQRQPKLPFFKKMRMWRAARKAARDGS